MVRHRLWVSNIAPPLLARLGVTPMNLENREAGAGHLLDRLQRWDFGDAAGGGSAHQGRPGQHEFRPRTARAVPGRSRDGVCQIASRRGPGAGFNTKIFLKRYALRYLPEAIVNRRKRGLSVPIGRWLRGPLREWRPRPWEAGGWNGLEFTRPSPWSCSPSIVNAEPTMPCPLDLARAERVVDWVATETDSRAGEAVKTPKAG